MKHLPISIFLLFSLILRSQTKISGIVVDESGAPVAFANVLFKDSSEGTITNDDGRFYMESENTYKAVEISFLGYKTQELPLAAKTNYNLKIVMEEESENLKEVVVYSGKQSKKNNPAIDILRKIWAKKRQNGLRMFDQYSYDKYEKVEFDLNTIDSAFMKKKVFRGLEFVFQDLDTSRITGKTYLPIFLNETFSKIYGDNKFGEEREMVMGNKNSGFNNNQAIIAFVKDLYSPYNIYDNYLKFFDKSFTSPLSTTGIDTYNYVLADSAYV